MAGLGFRPPQFSEDLVWLPAWLHQHQSEVSDESRKEPQNSSEPAVKDLTFPQGSISNKKCRNLLSGEEGRYNSYHLFLSGEDSSPNSFASSPANVVHLHLYLSSNSDLQHGQSQLASRGQYESNENLSVQQADISVAAAEKNYQSEMDVNAGVVDVLPQASILRTKEIVGLDSCPNSKHHDTQSAEKLNSRYLKDTDIDDAVELFVAASEALVIHELFKSQLDSEALPTAAVLEAALQMKQARLEGLQHTSHHPPEETNETDSLSDFDDLAMADAFEDIGLSLNGHHDHYICSSNVSIVKDTPVLENIHNCGNGSKHAEVLVQQETSDPAYGMKTYSSTNHIGPMVHQPSQKIPHVSLMAQENVGVPAQLTLNNAKSLFKSFVHETSFLSESADIAPDENSFAEKHEIGSKTDSQNNVQLEGLCDKTDESASNCQEVKSSNLSLVDPLCSIVPCSISSENSASPLDPCQKIRDVDAENCFGLTSKSAVENFQRTSDLEVKPIHGYGRVVPMIIDESLVQCKLTSLKNNSTLMLKYNAFEYPEKQNFEGSLPFRPISEKVIGGFQEENQNSTFSKTLNAKTTNDKRDDETAKDGAELQVQPLREMRSPVVLNQRMCCSLQASKPLLHRSIKEKSPELPTAQEIELGFHHCKNLQKLQTKSNSPCDARVPLRKRVRFSEFEVELQQENGLQKLQSLEKPGSTPGVIKRQESSNILPNYDALNVKRCFTTCRKHRKRLIFRGIDFLLTGFSRQREKDSERMIQKYGGVVLRDIPSPQSTSKGKRNLKSNFQQLPVLLCSKKLQSTRFLYACAVNAFILKLKWLTDSIAAGSVMPPEKYMILLNQANVICARIQEPVCCLKNKGIFDKVGIILHGKHRFCKKLAIIVKHGGGRVFKSLQWLVRSLDTEKVSMGAIIVEDESSASRHLRQCALERKIPMLPVSWIVKSLHSGHLPPYKESRCSPSVMAKVEHLPTSLEWSEEI